MLDFLCVCTRHTKSYAACAWTLYVLISTSKRYNEVLSITNVIVSQRPWISGSDLEKVRLLVFGQLHRVYEYVELT